jgi:hypothetical protein
MTIQFTFTSGHRPLTALVRDFALGLGYTVEDGPTDDAIRFVVKDGAEMLLRVLTHAALGAVRLGVDPREPLCEVRYREPEAPAEVAINLRLTDIHLKGVAAPR